MKQMSFTTPEYRSIARTRSFARKTTARSRWTSQQAPDNRAGIGLIDRAELVSRKGLVAHG